MKKNHLHTVRSCEVRTEVRTPCSYGVLSCIEDAAWGVSVKRMAFFNRQKAHRVLFAQYLYAAEVAEGGYYEIG